MGSEAMTAATGYDTSMQACHKLHNVRQRRHEHSGDGAVGSHKQRVDGVVGNEFLDFSSYWCLSSPFPDCQVLCHAIHTLPCSIIRC